MRRGCREGDSGPNDREAFALLGFCIEFRLVGQALELEDGRSDDRSGSENLTAYCYGAVGVNSTGFAFASSRTTPPLIQ
jgi:hypothetical protein